MTTGFFTDERTFWHSGGNYAGMMPVGGLVQPAASGGLPENPETKRRLRNMVEVTGLARDLVIESAPPVSRQDMERIHPASYLDEFERLSGEGGGELGLRAPFGPDGFDLAALSAGLATGALLSVLEGRHRNAYALSRPPGHHCEPDRPMGFCLLANIPIAIEAARAKGLATRFAVLDWDVHHGNGTEACFYRDGDVLTISLHQERNFPLETGGHEARGEGPGLGANLNIPLPPGTGHAGYLSAMERLALPAIRAFKPDVLIIACGFDAALNDPLGRMLATVETFRAMTEQVMAVADEVCGGRLVMAHEGGYSETYVPFCGHAVLAEMSGSAVQAPDPMAASFEKRQPGPAFDRFLEEWLSGMDVPPV